MIPKNGGVVETVVPFFLFFHLCLSGRHCRIGASVLAKLAADCPVNVSVAGLWFHIPRLRTDRPLFDWHRLCDQTCKTGWSLATGPRGRIRCRDIVSEPLTVVLGYWTQPWIDRGGVRDGVYELRRDGDGGEIKQGPLKR